MPSLREPFDALEGTTAVVTGAARGIGLEIARTLAEVGLGLVLVDRDADELAVAADELAGTDGGRETRRRPVCVGADLTTETGQAAISTALDELPPLSVWVNNAGTVSHQLSHDVDQETFEAVLRNNTWSAVRGARTAYTHMQHAGERAIVNVVSLVVVKAVPERLSYAASKAALETATRYMALDWGGAGIRVNAVSPGYIETRLTAWSAEDPRQLAKQASLRSIPMARFGQPEDVARVVLFLSSPLAAYVTGTTVYVDGGWHVT